MKIINKFLIAAIAVTLGFSSCSDDKEFVEVVVPFNPTMTDTQVKALLTTYTDDVIVNNYVTLTTDAKALLTACEAIENSPLADKTALITAACDAWKVARIQWERSESYLFGPVDTEGIDPGIDSWPLDLDALQTFLRVWSTTNDYTSLKGSGGSMKGFHALEYLLFAAGANKPVSITAGTDDLVIADDKEAKMESYLVAVSTELYRCVLQLEAEWSLATLSTSKKADLDAFGANIVIGDTEGKYAELLKTAGETGNTEYTSLVNGLDQIFNGCIIIADEVGGAKIADPINAEIDEAGSGLLLVESWFSHNSVLDFTNNMKGIRAAYYGTRNETANATSTSLSAYIASGSEELDAEVKAAINDAVEQVSSMDKPFRDKLSWSVKNLAAQNACFTLLAALEKAQGAIHDGHYVN